MSANIRLHLKDLKNFKDLDCLWLKPTGLTQLNDNLSSIKIHNLQQICGVSGRAVSKSLPYISHSLKDNRRTRPIRRNCPNEIEQSRHHPTTASLETE